MRALLALLLLIPAAPVKTGLEVLARDGFKPLQGKRVGIVTNHSAVRHATPPSIRVCAATATKRVYALRSLTSSATTSRP